MITFSPEKTFLNASKQLKPVCYLFDMILVLFLKSGADSLQFTPAGEYCTVTSTPATDTDFPPMPEHLERSMVEYYTALFTVPTGELSSNRTLTITGDRFVHVEVELLEFPEGIIRFTIHSNQLISKDYRTLELEFDKIRWRNMELFGKLTHLGKRLVGTG